LCLKANRLDFGLQSPLGGLRLAAAGFSTHVISPRFRNTSIPRLAPVASWRDSSNHPVESIVGPPMYELIRSIELGR
jgi:hypothetical protein